MSQPVEGRSLPSKKKRLSWENIQELHLDFIFRPLRIRQRAWNLRVCKAAMISDWKQNNTNPELEPAEEGTRESTKKSTLSLSKSY